MAKNVNTRKGTCTNFGNCTIADSKKIVEVDISDDFECPECQSELIPATDKKKNIMLIASIAASVLIVGTLAVLFLTGVFKLGNSEETVEESIEQVEETYQIQANATDGESVYDGPVAEDLIDPTLKWSAEKVEITAGESFKAPVLTVVPDDLGVEFTSSNEDLAVVAADGTVKLKEGATGSTIITAKYGGDCDFNSAEASYELKVNKKKTVSDGGVAKSSYGTFSGALRNGYPHGSGTLTYTRAQTIDKHDDKERIANAGDYIIGEWDNGHLIQGKLYDASNNVKGAIVIGKSMNPELDHQMGKFSR